MRTFIALLAFVAVTLAEEKPIKASDFPRVATSADWFEARINSSDPEIRSRVLVEVCYFGGSNPELVKFLRRMMRDDDAEVRGRAVKELYERWIHVETKDLPRTFEGYAPGTLIDRDDDDQIDKLIAQLRPQGPGGGYACYALGLLRAKKAVPRLRALGRHENIFVRIATARALLSCGDRAAARTIFDAVSAEQLERYGGAEGERHSWYAWKACRGLMLIDKEEGYRRAFRVWRHLELSEGVNDRSRLPYIRMQFADLAGRYFATSKSASAWYLRQAK